MKLELAKFRVHYFLFYETIYGLLVLSESESFGCKITIMLITIIMLWEYTILKHLFVIILYTIHE